jgi:hypothetical protein
VSQKITQFSNFEVLIDIDRKNYYSQLLNVHSVKDVKQIEIYTAESLVPDPSPFEVEIAIAKLKRYKLPGSDQIQIFRNLQCHYTNRYMAVYIRTDIRICRPISKRF